jgi:hypothetical protein
MKTKFTITISPKNKVQENELVNLGFKQELDNSLFTYSCSDRYGALRIARELAYDCYDLGWTLEKVVS